MMRFFITCLFSLLSLTFATQAQSKKKTNELIGTYRTIEGQTIEMFGSFFLAPEEFVYNLPNGKSKTEYHRHLKWMLVYNRAYLVLPRKKDRALALMEVIAISQDYILAKYWSTYNFFYIFDHNGNAVGEKMIIAEKGVTLGVEKNNKKVVDILKSHFNCPELIQIMNANIEAQRFLSDGLVVYRCDGAPELESIMEGLDKKFWYSR